MKISSSDRERIKETAKAMAREAVEHAMDKFSDFDVAQDAPDDDNFEPYLDAADKLFFEEFKKAMKFQVWE